MINSTLALYFSSFYILSIYINFKSTINKILRVKYQNNNNNNTKARECYSFAFTTTATNRLAVVFQTLRRTEFKVKILIQFSRINNLLGQRL